MYLTQLGFPSMVEYGGVSIAAGDAQRIHPGHVWNPFIKMYINL